MPVSSGRNDDEKMKEFITDKGRNAKLVGRKSKWVNGAGCYMIKVKFEDGWKTVVSNSYGGRQVIAKVKAEY